MAHRCVEVLSLSSNIHYYQEEQQAPWQQQCTPSLLRVLWGQTLRHMLPIRDNF